MLWWLHGQGVEGWDGKGWGGSSAGGAGRVPNSFEVADLGAHPSKLRVKRCCAHCTDWAKISLLELRRSARQRHRAGLQFWDAEDLEDSQTAGGGRDFWGIGSRIGYSGTDGIEKERLWNH